MSVLPRIRDAEEQLIYEIFRCTKWTEQVTLEVTIANLSSYEGKRLYILAITPNVPTEIPSMTVTMTAITLPPLPGLSTEFITDGRDVAISNNPFTPDLLCVSWRHARDMNCTLEDDCRCHAAENCQLCMPYKRYPDIFQTAPHCSPSKNSFLGTIATIQ
ncbi:hypothetical protein Aduo_005445 [Ancylostoma duodenale]